MVRAAIVGCGRIADAHAAQIARIPGCEIVGVCDREPLMARQLHERFPIRAPFTDLELRSGDLLVFGGPTRLIYHGVPNTFPGTAPAGLGLPPGRVSITVRQTGLSRP